MPCPTLTLISAIVASVCGLVYRIMVWQTSNDAEWLAAIAYICV
jgi:hypothetical protein